MMDTLYCITGINRLTRYRERISSIYVSYDKAATKCRELLSGRASKRAYIYPQVEPYQKDLFR